MLSDSTAGNDRGVKYQDYAAHGVGEYWIVDPVAEILEQYLLEGETYDLRLKSDSGEVTSRVIQGLRIPVRALFDSAVQLQTLRDLLERIPALNHARACCGLRMTWWSYGAS